MPRLTAPSCAGSAGGSRIDAAGPREPIVTSDPLRARPLASRNRLGCLQVLVTCRPGNAGDWCHPNGSKTLVIGPKFVGVNEGLKRPLTRWPLLEPQCCLQCQPGRVPRARFVLRERPLPARSGRSLPQGVTTTEAPSTVQGCDPAFSEATPMLGGLSPPSSLPRAGCSPSPGRAPSPEGQRERRCLRDAHRRRVPGLPRPRPRRDPSGDLRQRGCQSCATRPAVPRCGIPSAVSSQSPSAGVAPSRILRAAARRSVSREVPFTTWPALGLLSRTSTSALRPVPPACRSAAEGPAAAMIRARMSRVRSSRSSQ